MFKMMSRVRLIIYCAGVLILLALVLGKTAIALDPAREMIQYGHSVWRTENGLPQNTVRAILQTRNGYIWLATEEGLARFDGISFTVFDKQNTPEIRSNSVQVLHEDRAGNLWIGTDEGLVRWKNGAFASYSADNGLSHNNISSLYEDRAGNLWVGTANGLNRIEGDRITSYTTGDGLPNGSIGL